jgi:hypothetical protein
MLVAVTELFLKVSNHEQGHGGHLRPGRPHHAGQVVANERVTETDLDMEAVREFGKEALKARLGELARLRRSKDLGISREALAAASGIGSTKTIRDFEFGLTVPQEINKARFEKALGWRAGAIDDVLSMTSTKASSITMDMVDSPSRAPSARPLKGYTTAELLKELLVRLPRMVEAEEGAQQDTQFLYGLAANNDPSHLERLAEEGQ